MRFRFQQFPFVLCVRGVSAWSARHVLKDGRVKQVEVVSDGVADKRRLLMPRSSKWDWMSKAVVAEAMCGGPGTDTRIWDADEMLCVVRRPLVESVMAEKWLDVTRRSDVVVGKDVEVCPAGSSSSSVKTTSKSTSKAKAKAKSSAKRRRESQSAVVKKPRRKQG